MKNSTFKMIGVVTIVIIALWLLLNILYPTGYGISMNYSMPIHMGNGFNYSFGFNNFSGSATLLLALLIKVFLIALFVTLLFGIFMYVKNNVFTKEEVDTMKNTFTSKQSKSDKTCLECREALNAEWKVCPYCGKVIEKF